MEYKITIPGTLPNLNDHIKACNKSPYAGNDMKQCSLDLVYYRIKKEIRTIHINVPIHIKYTFYEPNRKRDKDNVASYAMKVIQDALVNAGTIENDGWKQVDSFSCYFDIDKDNPRIEVTLIELPC